MYLVIELQTTNGVTSNIVTAYQDIHQAESKYFQILAAAALSQVDKHGAVILTSEGYLVRQECFIHEQPEETPGEE